MEVFGCYSTTPQRLNFTSAIDSFARQTYPIKNNFLSIPYGVHNSSLKEYYVPRLPSYYKKIKIIRTYYDFGPATKVLGCMDQVSNNSFLFVIDDDIEYLPDLLETLVKYSKNESVISFETCSASSLGGVCGFEGFLIRKNVLNGIRKFYEKLPRECIYVDDMWIGVYLMLRNINVRYITSYKHSIFTRLQSWKSTLFDSTSLSHKTLSHSLNNEICFKRIFENIMNTGVKY